MREEDGKSTRASLRPVLYIGLGGFGCDVLRELKRKIARQGQDYLNGVAFIGLDTHVRAIDDELSTTEYIEMALGVHPETVARNDTDFLGWYLKVAPYLKAKVVGGGADQIKAVGRLAFRHTRTFEEFTGVLNSDWEYLRRPRERFNPDLEPKVYVISTVAGGTGSGCLLDALLTVGKYIQDNAPGATFQAVLATGDVLVGEVANSKIPWLRSNTFSTLKELHHFYHSDGSKHESYSPTCSNVELGPQNLPDHTFLVGGEGESGAVVASKIKELLSIVVSYLHAEIRTPATGSNVQVFDFENAHSFGSCPFPDKTIQRNFASFGVVQAGFPDDVAGDYFTLLIVQELLSRELRTGGDAEAYEAADVWLKSKSLKEAGDDDQLQDRIATAVGGELMEVNIDASGAILQKKVKKEKLAAECRSYRKDIEERFASERRTEIMTKADEIAAYLNKDLVSALAERVDSKGIGEAVIFLNKLEAQLKNHRTALEKELTDATKKLGELEEETDRSIKTVSGCLECHFWERKSYIRDSLSTFGQLFEGLLEMRLKVWVMKSAETVYNSLIDSCSKVGQHWHQVKTTTEGRLKAVEDAVTNRALVLDQLASIQNRGAGNRFSLVNAKRARLIYKMTVGSDLKGVLSRTRTAWLKDGQLTDTQLKPQKWLDVVLPDLLGSEVKPKIKDYNILKVMDTFYPKEADKRILFGDLARLCQPLFKFNANKAVAIWDESWVFAVHPDLENRLRPLYDRHFQANVDNAWAHFDSPYEMVIYRIKAAYALCQHLNLPFYKGAYEQLQKACDASSQAKALAKPVDAWPDARYWPDPGGEIVDEKAYRLFVLGRAFTDLFPDYGIVTNKKTRQTTLASNKKGDAFILQSGSRFYLRLAANERKITIGQSLAEAVSNFAKQQDWQRAIESRIEAASETITSAELKTRLETWVQKLRASIEATADKKRTEEEEALFRTRQGLLDALEQHIEDSLSGGIL